MTEQEYINVRDLESVYCARQCLDRVVAEISDVIPSTELAKVKELLFKWEIDLYKEIKTEPEQ